MNDVLPSLLTDPSARARLPALCARYGVRRLDIFGSAVTDRFDPATSDLDFFVTFAPLEPVAFARAYFELRDGLAALFGRDVDLLTESTLANPYFRRQVELERRTVFEAP
jgi:hypothetical protein